MRTALLNMVGAILLTSLLAAPAAAIENVKGKHYQLTSKHGPWMVMVTSFRNVHDRDLKTEGMTAEQAAAELVYELREQGIPAYTFSQDAVLGEIDTKNRLGRDDHRIYAAQRDMICVLAGNYDSIEDKEGQKTLKRVKRFHPQFLKSTRSGAILRLDAAQRGPLAGAFMTINPLLKPEDVVQRTVDKETKYLNTGIQYPLVKTAGRYTVRVATFEGKSATPLGSSAFRDKESEFDANLRKSERYNIVRAGEDAEQLAAYLRNKGRNVAGADPVLYEAYVYHDKFQSIVTIGGFESPDDPRIRLIGQHYSPKLMPDLRLLAGRQRPGQPLTPDDVDKLPKILTTHTEQMLPLNASPDTPPLQIWTFDPEPKVIPIPRIK